MQVSVGGWGDVGCGGITITTSRRVIRLVLPGWEESGAYYPTIKRTTSDPGRVYGEGENLVNFPEVQRYSALPSLGRAR